MLPEILLPGALQGTHAQVALTPRVMEERCSINLSWQRVDSLDGDVSTSHDLLTYLKKATLQRLWEEALVLPGLVELNEASQRTQPGQW